MQSIEANLVRKSIFVQSIVKFKLKKNETLDGINYLLNLLQFIQSLIYLIQVTQTR